MTAKEVRELAAKQMKNMEGQYKVEYDNIMTSIKASVMHDATKTSISVDSISPVVKAKLTDNEHRFEVEYVNDRNDYYYTISWENYV